MASDRLWIGIALLTLGAFLIIPVAWSTLMCAVGTATTHNAVIHIGAGRHLIPAVTHFASTLVRTAVPFAMLGLGIYLVARSR